MTVLVALDAVSLDELIISEDALAPEGDSDLANEWWNVQISLILRHRLSNDGARAALAANSKVGGFSMAISFSNE